MRALLIVNPHATTTTPGGRDVLAHALASVVKLDVVETTCRGHAAELATKAKNDDYQLIVAHGGDGTVNEVVNGIIGADHCADVPLLGVVPGGSANVFAGALGLPRDPIEATHRLLRAIENRTSRKVSLGKVTVAGGAVDQQRWFTFNAGMGWDAEAVARVEDQRADGAKATTARYLRAVVASYGSQWQHAPTLKVWVPVEQPQEVHLVFVSNTAPWSFLRSKPINLNPSTSFDTGLGVFALKKLGPATVLRYATHLLATTGNPRGKHLLRRDDLSYVRATSPEPINLQVDGDLLGSYTEAEFTTHPKAISVAI